MKFQKTAHPEMVFLGMMTVLFAMELSNAGAVDQAPDSHGGRAASQTVAWLAGSGRDLRIKIAGEVLDENGKPAKGCHLNVYSLYPFRDLPTAMSGNRFEVWIPVGNAGLWSALYVNATSADGRRIARKRLLNYEFRQAAADGLVLKMKKPERFVAIKVVEDGRAVPNAFVTAEYPSGRLSAKTNAAGVATFPLMNRDKLSQLTAWTEDFKIGGYALYNDPPRDPFGGKFTVELDRCRPQKIRIVNEKDKTPVAGLSFLFTVTTGPPNYQSPGQTPDCQMTTDKNGEAVYRWFPDWKTHHNYVEITDPHWVKAADEQVVDGTIVVKVRKSQFDKRKRVVGTVTSADGNVPGFAVSIESFQGEQKHQTDILSTFTDQHGRFEASYLPGATYCICVNDAQFVSNIVDLIPYEPATSKTSTPLLTISKGQPVEIVVTSGPAKSPVVFQGIELETPHEYSWREGGRTQHGQGGRRWWVITDEQGKAYTFALPGRKIKGFLYSPTWWSEEAVQVKPDGLTKLKFHQKVAAKRKILGRLILADNLHADLNGAIIEVGSIDGETNERLTLKADADGSFTFQSQASQIGIYARTKDSKAAAVSIVDSLDQPIALALKPTGEFRGQLLGKENRPLRDHAVRAVLFVSGKQDDSKPLPTGFSAGFSAATFESKTDNDGNYSLTRLPQEVKLDLRADPIDASGGKSYLGEFYLVPNESRPRAVDRLWRPKTKISFSERYANTLRDCRLSHFHAMVIAFQPSDDTKRFVNANLMDYEKTKEVTSYIQFQAKIGDAAPTNEIAGFVRSQGWPIPAKGRVFACAVDPTGKELGRAEFDVQDPNGPALAAQFLRKYAPKPVDARDEWNKAFALAKKTNRKVWVRISQRYCGPCFRLARWLDDQKDILEKDYVLLKIDNVRDLHGNEVTKRVTNGKSYGVPFFAIFDADGRMLINGDSKVGNIGFPSGFEGKKHLRQMLAKTHDHLTDQEIEKVVSSLSD